MFSKDFKDKLSEQDVDFTGMFTQEIDMSDVFKRDRFREITEEMKKLYNSKNKDYGDSFGKVYDELGFTSALTMILHKVERLKAEKLNHESRRDSLIDLANYAIMTIIEMEEER